MFRRPSTWLNSVIAHATAQAFQRRTLTPAAIRALFGTGRHPVEGQTVVVTGASAGIGREVVRQLGARGAHVIAVARREDELRSLSSETGCRYHVCDLSDEAAITELVDTLRSERVDVLINNAGHSIRRPVTDSTDRLHDYQRTVQLNYLAAVQLTLGVVPGMVERGDGHIVNICTWGLLAGTFPRFSAYAASKNALAIFGRSVAAELPQINTTTVLFPLVRTAMIAPTAEYDDAPAISVLEAGQWVTHAVTHRPASVGPVMLRTLLPALDQVAPRAADRLIAALT